MRLTTRGRYGTRMILDIAQHGQDGPVRIADIAKRQAISVKYLEKIIRELREAGYVRSRRGPKGGHMLTKSASDITVGEIVKVLEGNPRLVECLGEKTCDRSAMCLTRRLWQDASDAMYAKLGAVTFADLLSDRHQCPDNGEGIVKPIR